MDRYIAFPKLIQNFVIISLHDHLYRPMKSVISFILFILACSSAPAQNTTLDYYLQAAKDNSPLLKDLRNQVAQTQLDSLRLRAVYKPQVNASSAGYFSPVINGYGYSCAITNIQTFNALLGVNKQLIGKNYLNTQLAQITLQRDSITNNLQISALDLNKAITTQYITAYGSLQQIKFGQDVVGLLKKEEGLLKSLTRANIYKQTDYLTFLVTLKSQQLQLTQATIQYKYDLATLNYLSGIADTTMKELITPVLNSSVTPQLYASIFFKKFQTDSSRFINNRRLVDFSYRPKASIFADGGYYTDFSYLPYKNFGTSFGFSISVPIYDGGQRRLQYKRILLEQETSLNYKAFFTSQYRQQINQINQQITETEKLIIEINNQLKYTESLIKADTELLQTGDLKIADLILAVNSYLTVKNLLTQTTISRLQLISQLNYWNQ